MDIKSLYENTELTMQTIADQLGTTYKAVFNYVKKNYSSSYRRNRKAKTYRNSKSGELNPMSGKVREQHPRYIGVVSDCKGYLMAVKPEWYSGRRGSHHVFVHHLVMCEHLGITEIPRGYCVHHCDFNPHNNDIGNLVLLTVGEHSALHHALAGATTISKESTAKWLEAHRAGIRQDIVCSAQECAAARNGAGWD